MPLCDKFISGLNTSEERVSELEDISIETSHTEKQKENKTEKKQYPRTVEQLQEV